jgi:hypothetical protein
MKRTLQLALLASIALSGCQTEKESEPPNMSQHIFNALKIPSAKDRDAALVKACLESADEGAWPAVIVGIPRIEAEPLRNSTAEDCARKFHEAGNKKAAMEILNLMTDDEKQQELISEFQ